MARIEWEDSLSVHNIELDNQHKKLFQLYNNLHESLMQDSVEETTKTKLATLDGLTEYISYHFETEERFLESINFPNLSEHLESHKEFTAKINAFKLDVEENRIVLSTALIKILRNWILEHIAQVDQRYATYNRNI